MAVGDSVVCKYKLSSFILGLLTLIMNNPELLCLISALLTSLAPSPNRQAISSLGIKSLIHLTSQGSLQPSRCLHYLQPEHFHVHLSTYQTLHRDSFPFYTSVPIKLTVPTWYLKITISYSHTFCLRDRERELGHLLSKECEKSFFLAPRLSFRQPNAGKKLQNINQV